VSAGGIWDAASPDCRAGEWGTQACDATHATRLNDDEDEGEETQRRRHYEGDETEGVGDLRWNAMQISASEWVATQRRRNTAYPTNRDPRQP